MCCQWQQHLVHQDHMLEIVDDGLSVEEVHGGGQPVPVEALGRPQLAGAARDARNGNDLAKRDDLDGRDDEDDVDVPHEQRGEEPPEHDKGPEGPRHEVGLFLLVGGLDLGGRRGLLHGRLELAGSRYSRPAWTCLFGVVGLGAAGTPGLAWPSRLVTHVAEAGTTGLGRLAVAFVGEFHPSLVACHGPETAQGLSGLGIPTRGLRLRCLRVLWRGRRGRVFAGGWFGSCWRMEREVAANTSSFLHATPRTAASCGARDFGGNPVQGWRTGLILSNCTKVEETASMFSVFTFDPCPFWLSRVI